MNQLVESIREHGVLVPGLVRQNGDRYELVSGHRRKRACELLGLPTMPVVIWDMSREEAIIAMVDSNIQRDHILPSEKAFAYKMKMDALAHQGKTSRQIGEKWSVTRISEDGIDSERQVHRFIRLTNLIPEILQKVDEGRIALTPAVELSYLSKEEQSDLQEIMESEDCTPSLSQAVQLKQLSQAGQVDVDAIFRIMTQPKANQTERLKIPMERIRRYFPKSYTAKQLDDEIVKLCEVHFRRRSERER